MTVIHITLSMTVYHKAKVQMKYDLVPFSCFSFIVLVLSTQTDCHTVMTYWEDEIKNVCWEKGLNSYYICST